MSENLKRWREKDGRLIHDGDCHFWGSDICTCGLIHHLMPKSFNEEWYSEEWARHEIQMERVTRKLPPEPYVKPTPEELAERQKLLEELFPGIDIDLTKDPKE